LGSYPLKIEIANAAWDYALIVECGLIFFTVKITSK